MYSEWTQTTTVKKGGRIVLVVPVLEEGARVEVVVRSEEDSGRPKGRTFGSARGQGHMRADFDEPLSDFKEYS